jgi:CMP-N-acetylneuraminic acid synthetase
MKTLAIIPARGGSKGIREKNVVGLGGKPLIEHTIRKALQSNLINRVIVSTDSKKIAEVAQSYGAEVPFLRPRKISGDSSPTISTVKHAIQFLKEQSDFVPDIILLLQPTSPFRTVQMIDRSIRILKKSNASSIISVSKIKKHPYSSFTLKNKLLQPYRKNFEKFSLRQKIPSLYYPTGAIYTFWSENLKQNSIYGTKIKPMLINDERINIDIDTPFDLFMAEMIIKKWKEFSKN